MEDVTLSSQVHKTDNFCDIFVNPTHRKCMSRKLNKGSGTLMTITEEKNGAKMASPWSRFGKRCHFEGWSRTKKGAILWTWKWLHCGAISAPLFSSSDDLLHHWYIQYRKDLSSQAYNELPTAISKSTQKYSLQNIYKEEEAGGKPQHRQQLWKIQAYRIGPVRLYPNN